MEEDDETELTHKDDSNKVLEEIIKVKVEMSKVTGHTLSLYYWGLSKLGVSGGDPIFSLLDQLTAKHPLSLTL